MDGVPIECAIGVLSRVGGFGYGTGVNTIATRLPGYTIENIILRNMETGVVLMTGDIGETYPLVGYTLYVYPGRLTGYPKIRRESTRAEKVF